MRRSRLSNFCATAPTSACSREPIPTLSAPGCNIGLQVSRVRARPMPSVEDEMPIEIGQIEAIFRYPVKSMRGEPLDAAALGWHGLEGDRRLAFRRVDERGDFPWLTAVKLPDLVRFTPQRRDERANAEALPTHVRT